MSTLTKIILTIIAFFGGFWLIRRLIQPDNDLRQHFREEKNLSDIGILTQNQQNKAMIPMATIGDTPLAGHSLDPFIPDSPGNVLKPIVWNQTAGQDASAPAMIDITGPLLLGRMREGTKNPFPILGTNEKPARFTMPRYGPFGVITRFWENLESTLAARAAGRSSASRFLR